MAHIVSITNQKGGVGKTTTHVLGTALSRAEKSVLFIDLDPQRNLSHTLKAYVERGSIYEVLAGTIPIGEAIQQTAQGDCLCASSMLSGADRSLDRTGKEYILKEALLTVGDNYDFILIDTPPALGILTVNALPPVMILSYLVRLMYFLCRALYNSTILSAPSENIVTRHCLSPVSSSCGSTRG